MEERRAQRECYMPPVSLAGERDFCYENRTGEKRLFGLMWNGFGADQLSKYLVEGVFFTFKGWGFSGCTFFATCNLQVKISVVENALNITTCNCLEARYYWNIRVKYLWRGYPSVSRGLGIPASADGVSSPPTCTSDAPVYAPLKPKPNLHSGAIALPEPEPEDAFSVVKPTIFPK